MNSIEFIFERPWLLLLAVPALAVVLVPFLLLPKKNRKTVKKILPVIFHIIIVILLVLLVAGFTIVRNSKDQSVMILVDMSDSTSGIHETLEERAQEIADLIDSEAPLGVIAFGEDTAYSLELTEGARNIKLTGVNGEATNIAAALEYAAEQMPKDQARRIILLSDGMETDGDAERAAYYLSTQDVRIDAMYFDTTGLDTAEMQISSFTAPEGAYVGDDVTLIAEVESNVKGTARLALYDNGVYISTLDCEISSGSNIFELKANVGTAGTHSYILVLQPSDDTLAQNNEARAYLSVAGESTVLIIAHKKDEAASLETLFDAENEVTVVTSVNAPDSIVELCNYDEVVLMNVDYADLPEGYDKLLETYVSTYGRSLLTIGGRNTYMYGNMQETAIEGMLPTSFTLDDDDPANAVALMLVLDTSQSMSDQEGFLSVAKQGAAKCVEVMSSIDYIGVVSFNRYPELVAPLAKATETQKDETTRIISGLSTAHGTYYSSALDLARQELNKIDAPTKHIIFLSDGSPADHGYYQMAEDVAKDGISISTIGLVFAARTLETIAQNGNGRYYYVDSPEDLPDIMLSEAEEATGSFITGQFTPVITTESDLTEGLEEETLPMITGYTGMTVKEAATAYITTDTGHPLFASWQYGMGTVASFTSDLSGEWSSEWLSSAVGQTIITRMVEATVSDVHRDSSLSVEITQRGKSADIEVMTSGDSTGHTLEVTVASDSGSNDTYKFSQKATGVYECSVDAAEKGIYELMIVQKDASGKVIDSMQTALAMSYSAEYDAFAEGGQDLLVNLCRYSNGKVTNDIEELTNFKVSVIAAVYDPMIPFGIIAAILLVCDIAVRKLKWKDVKKYLMAVIRLFNKNAIVE